MFERKARVILDTNFFLVPGQFKVNVFSEIERVMDRPYTLYVIDKTLEELQNIAMLGKVKDRESAKLGLALLDNLIKQKSLKTMSSSSHKIVDDIIVEKTSKHIYVATNDKELKRRVKEAQGSIITLKQKKYLVKE